MNDEDCQNCKKLTDTYLKCQPAKNGSVMCMSCYEKSKQTTEYVQFPYEGVETPGWERFKKSVQEHIENLKKQGK